ERSSRQTVAARRAGGPAVRHKAVRRPGANVLNDGWVASAFVLFQSEGNLVRRCCLLLAAVLVFVVLAGCAGAGRRGKAQGGTFEWEVMQTPAGKTYDLIPLIDPARDRQHGDWVVQANGELRCDSAHFVPRIHVPYRPPQEYDFTVVFSQPALR